MGAQSKVTYNQWNKSVEIPKHMKIDGPVSCQFRIEIRLMRQLFESVQNAVGAKATLEIDPKNGLFMRAISPTTIVLCELRVTKDNLQEFACEKKTQWDLDLKNFVHALNFMETGRETTYVWFQSYGDNPDKLSMRRECPSYAWIDMNLLNDIDQVPTLKENLSDELADCVVYLNAETWNRVTDYVDDFGDSVTLTVEDDKVKMTVHDKMTGVEYSINDQDKTRVTEVPKIRITGKKIESQTFSSVILKIFSKSFQAGKVAEIRFYESVGLIKVTYAVANTDEASRISNMRSTLTYYMANKVPEPTVSQ